MNNTVFGFTEAQISDFFSTYGIIGLILFMLFIIGHLAWESKAGKIGTIALFAVLALGIFSFVAKYIIKWVLHIN